MRVSVVLSILMHTLFFTALVVLPSGSRSLPRIRNVVEVALVSVPRSVEAVPEEAEPPKPERPREPSPDVVVKPKEESVEKTAAVENKAIPKASESDSLGSTAGVAGGQVKVETENFPFAYYLALIRYRIQENWRPPVQNTGDRDKMTAIVGFRVLRDGRIQDVNLEMSSGRFLFDQAAQRAIHVMGNLPPLPDDFSGDHLTVHIEFESVW